MIVFYNKTSGAIYGTIAGRVHPAHHDNMIIKPGNIPVEQVGIYKVKYERRYEVVEKKRHVLKIDPATMQINRVEVGTQKIKRSTGLHIADTLKDFFTGIEDGTLKIHDYKFVINKKGRVVGFEKLPARVAQPQPKLPTAPEGSQEVRTLRLEVDRLTAIVTAMQKKAK